MLKPTGQKTFEQDGRGPRVVRDGFGLARLASEAARMAAMMRAATPPAECGGDIPVAPARGAFRVVTPLELVPGSEARVRQSGYRGPGEAAPRAGVVLADVFDRMARDAARAGAPEPFSAGQVAAARRYRDLVERHEAGGVKCSSLEARAGGSSRGGDVADARLIEGREIEAMRRRVGTGVALAVRRLRPSARGGASTGIITDRALVDAVCLQGLSLSAVLRAHGWSCYGGHREALRTALAGALDRMQGYPLRSPTR